MSASAGLALLSSGCWLDQWRAPTKLPRIGYMALEESQSTGIAEAFLGGLRDLGYVEGQTIRIEWRFSTAESNRFSELAAELARLPVDVIVTNASTPAALAAKHATSTIPVVAVNAIQPVQTGLVDTLARPGGNVTGLAVGLPGFPSKRFDLLREVLPNIMRAAAFVNATNSGFAVIAWNEVMIAAQQAGVALERIDVRSAEDVNAAFEAAVSSRPQALFGLQAPLWDPVRARVGKLVLQSGLPAMFEDRPYVEAGALMSYSTDTRDIARRAALYVDRILKGARPADLPVEQPSKYDLFMNATTVRLLGLTIPLSVSPLVTEWIQ